MKNSMKDGAYKNKYAGDIMKILVIDSNLDIGDQLRKIAEDTGIPLISLSDAWNEQNITQPVNVKDFAFDLIPEKIDHTILEKRLSYQAQQKQLPKFLKKKKW